MIQIICFGSFIGSCFIAVSRMETQIETQHHFVIKNGSVFRQGCFHDEDVYIKDGRFLSETDAAVLGRKSFETIDAGGLLVLPGLTDIHLHGAMGCDFSDGDEVGIETILSYEASAGIGQVVPATLSLPKKQLERAVVSLGKAVAAAGIEGGALPAGIHIEGSYINPKKCGAQNPSVLKEGENPSFAHLRRLSGDTIRIVSIAPEIKGAFNLIHEISPFALVSLAHTAADYNTASAAFLAGASHVTHLFNAMAPFHHRKPGIAGAAADHGHVSVELIADGVHVHPSVIRAVFRLFSGRVILVSDSMRATGLGDGVYDLGGRQVTVSKDLAVTENGTIAGSVKNLFDCLRYAVSIGIPVAEAVFAASEYPASRIGIDKEAGTILPCRRANFSLVTNELKLVKMFIDGRPLS